MVEAKIFRRIYSTAVLMFAVMALAACTPPGSADYREAFPITAKKVTFALDVKIAENGAISGPEIRRLTGFSREFLRRSRTPLVINLPAGAKPATDSGASLLRQQLVRNGLSESSIRVEPIASGGKPKDRYVLSFNGFAVQVPKCGDWSGEAGFNPSGVPNRNYGCAYQRNIGLMLVDPGDLVAPRADGLRTAQETDRVLGSFREGKPTDTEKREGATGGTVSGVGQQ